MIDPVVSKLGSVEGVEAFRHIQQTGKTAWITLRSGKPHVLNVPFRCGAVPQNGRTLTSKLVRARV